MYKHLSKKVVGSTTPNSLFLFWLVKDVPVFAREEVVLSAGAIDTPKLLMLSGIGPREELVTHSIPIVKELLGVGKNLYDHLFMTLVTVQNPGSHHRTSYLNSLEAFQTAREDWIKDGTGPLADFYLPQMISFFRSEKILGSDEFQQLGKETRDALRAKTKPSHEIITVGDCLDTLSRVLRLSILRLS